MNTELAGIVAEADELAQRAAVTIVERSDDRGKRSAPAALLVAALGLIAGLLLFVGPVTVKGFLFARITSEAGLEAISPVPVLVSVPLLAAHEVVEENRRRTFHNLALSLLSVTASCAVVILLL